MKKSRLVLKYFPDIITSNVFEGSNYMNRTTSNAVNMTNREFFRMREENALRKIPGVKELLRTPVDQRAILEERYPDAVFA